MDGRSHVSRLPKTPLPVSQPCQEDDDTTWYFCRDVLPHGRAVDIALRECGMRLTPRGGEAGESMSDCKTTHTMRHV
jgi:hypothetical protein